MKQTIFSIILTLCVAALPLYPILAEDNSDTFDGSVNIGFRYADGDDSLNHAAEYDSVDTDGAATVDLNIAAGNEKRSITIEGSIENENELNTEVHFRANPFVHDTFTFSRFEHRAGHDYLDNLTARESADPSINKPGGKMITHHDWDPDGEYGTVVSELKNNLEIKLGEHADMFWTYRDLSRKGYKQTRSLNHCSMCHVNARRTRVDEETRDHTVGLNLSFSKLNVIYQYMVSKFHNYVDAPRNYWDAAVHPTNGESGAELGARTNFQDVELPYARIPETKKYAHDLKFYSDLNDSNSIVGRFSISNLKNEMENLQMDTDYGAFKWMYRTKNNLSLTATVSRESIDNDSVRIDLPNWREGRQGGGQDFDWTRQSAYNRDVLIGKLEAFYRLSKTQSLGFTYRYRSIDRDYLEIEQGTSETETLQNLFKATWNTRTDNTRGRFSVAYEMTDTPFANKYAMCEEESQYTQPLPGNPFVYYFQRERIGEGSNQPTDSLRLNADFSLLKGANFSLNFQGSYHDDKNDELNTYEWTRDMLNLGVNLFFTASNTTAVSLGYNYLDTTSSAMFCVPVMDG